MQINKIQKIEPSSYEGLVYNIEVENDNSYLLENLIVHNCQPAASLDVIFDRASLERMESIEPIRIIAGLKIFKEYDPAHRYGAGIDVGGGIGLDSSTNVIIDFDTIPAQVVATFNSNEIRPDAFGLEVARHGERYGECILAPENNKFDIVIGQLRQVYPIDKIFKMERKSTKVKGGQYTDYGFNMNVLTKPKIFYDLSKAVDDGLLLLNDINLINEAKSYSRDDIMDKSEDPRLTTRHFDLLTSCFIKKTLVLTNKGQRPIETIGVGDMVMTRDGYKRVKAVTNHKKEIITNIGLTGTANHPVFCGDNEVKDLISIDADDSLYIWDSKAQKIERLSYIKALPIIGIQKQKTERIESIFKVGQSGRFQQNTYIGRFGKIILGKFQKALLFIIKTMILLTTILKIWICYPGVIIQNFIQQKKEKNNLELISKRIEKNSKLVSEDTIKIKQRGMPFVLFVGNHLKPLLIMLFFVLDNVHKELGGKEEKNPNKRSFVQFVEKDSKHVFHIKKDVQLNALLLGTKNRYKKKFAQFVGRFLSQRSFGKKIALMIAQKRDTEGIPVCEEGNYQRVYNLEVEETPEYFANNILVHNCAIAFLMRDYAEFPKIQQEEENRQRQNREERKSGADYIL